MLKLGIFLLALSLGCSGSDLSIENIIDLGHELYNDAPIYPLPGVEHFDLQIVDRSFMPTGWRATNRFTATSLSGTEFQAPYFAYKDGWKVDEVPLEHLFAEINIIDIREKVANNNSYSVTSEDIMDWIEANGLFMNNSVLLFRTGFSSRYNDSDAYYGGENLEFPGVNEDAARTILRLMRSHGISIVGVGIDGPCLEPYPVARYLTHQLFASLNIYSLPNLVNLELLPLTGARIMVMPAKFRGASSTPTRVMAHLPYYE